MFYSQSGQDEWVLSKITEPGFFVELGAYDGVSTSNSYALENAGWRGICVEANPEFYERLCKNRPSASNLHGFVSDKPGSVRMHEQWQTDDPNFPEVPAFTLGEILRFYNAPRVIDYLSIDIEGMELPVFRSFDFAYKFKLMTVEHNVYLDGPANKDGIYRLLTGNGYVLVRDNVLCLDTNPAHHLVPYEDWYAHEDFLSGRM